jgi:hypothetical protein
MSEIISATFNAECSFLITGRGLMFAGDILSGTISRGDTIILQEDPDSFHKEIIGIEFGTNAKTGLLIKCENLEEQQALRQWEIEGKVFLILPPQV